jgi:hypothetical protein
MEAVRSFENGVGSALLTRCRPANILRRVRPVVVNPIKAYSFEVPIGRSSWQAQYVCQEIGKGQAPSVTNHDAATAIFTPALVPFVVTSILHHAVALAQWMVRKAVFVIPFGELFRMKAAATRTPAVAELSSTDVTFCSAVTSAGPVGFFIPNKRLLADDQPSAKALPCQNNQFHQWIRTVVTNTTLVISTGRGRLKTALKKRKANACN